MANYINNLGQIRLGWRTAPVFTPDGPGTPNTIDTDTTNFILASGISDSLQISAIETLVSDLKAYGLWTKMKAIYPFVGGSAASHKWNLKDPRNLDAAYRLVFNGGWIHSSNGAKPNGSTGYADTFFNPSTNLSNSTISNHLSTYIRENIDELKVDIGLFSGSNGLGWDIETRISNTAYYPNLRGNNYITFVNTDSRGLHINTRTTSTSQKVFINSTLKGTDTGSTTGTINSNVSIAARYNIFNSSYEYRSSKEQAFVSIGDGLTDTDASNLYISVQKFQTTLGRHVGTPYVSDPDAIAFLIAAGITDGTQAAAINTLVIRMKADGVWTKMKAIYPFVGGTAASHKWNLKDPRDLDTAFRLVFYGGMTHTNLGMVSNYTTSYASTNLTPSTTLSSFYSQHVSVYSQTSTATPANNINSIGEWQDSTRAMIMKVRNLSNVFSWEVGNSGVSVTNNDGRGFYLASTIANNSIKLYKDNTNVATNTSTFSGSLPSQVQPIGKNENKTFSFATIGDGLTDTDALNFYTAVQSYQTSLGRQVNVPLVSDTDAQTFLNTANITSFQQASAVNKLVVDLKAAGVWTKMMAIYPFVGGSADSHKWNLKDPRDLNASFRLQFNGGWTHNSNGVTPNGTNGYADTYLTPNTSLSLLNQHISFYSRTNSASGVDIAAGESAATIQIWGSTLYYDVSSGGYKTVSVSNSTGLIMAQRLNYVNNVFKNNSKIKTDNLGSYEGFLSSTTIELSRVRTGGYYSNKNLAFATIGNAMSDTEASDFYTAVETYQTSLGRGVNTPIYNNGLVLNLDAGNANSYPGTGTTWFDLATSTNGTLVNSPTFNSNQFTFNGSNQFVNFGNTNNIGTDSVTLVAWVKTIANQDYAGIIGKAFYGDKLGRFSLHTRSGGKLGIITQSLQNGSLSNVEATSTQNINTGNWVFVVGVIDRSYGNKLYINGVLDVVSTRDTSGLNWSTTDNFTIGFYNGNGSGYFNGSISNAFMYRRVLTDNEIINLYNSTRGRFGL